MGWTKKQFINQAFTELGMSNYVYDMSPSDYQSALAVLDAMIAEWGGLGINLGYPLSSNPDNSNLDSSTRVPISSNAAIYTNLALKIAPNYGKNVQIDTRINAKMGFNTLYARACQPPQMQLPRHTPAGAGNMRGPGLMNPFLVLESGDMDIGEPEPDVSLPQGI